jgi:hypothetical protein
MCVFRFSVSLKNIHLGRVSLCYYYYLLFFKLCSKFNRIIKKKTDKFPLIDLSLRFTYTVFPRTRQRGLIFGKFHPLSHAVVGVFQQIVCVGFDQQLLLRVFGVLGDAFHYTGRGEASLGVMVPTLFDCVAHGVQTL